MNRWAAIIADDDVRSRSRLADYASDLGYEVAIASNPEEIAASSHDASPDGRVIVVSASLPGLDPKRLRRELSRSRGHAWLIQVVDRHAPETVTAAFEAGADDVIAKPLIVAEVRSRLHNAARVLELEVGRNRFEGEASLLNEISARTIMHSRRYFDAQLLSELTRASRYAHSTGLVLVHLDWEMWTERDMRALDNFFSTRIRASVDWLSRYDAHTRAFVLPETTLYGALSVARRMHAAFPSAAPAPPVGIFRNLSISFGVISLDPAQISAGHLPDSRIMIEAAEAYLTDARRSGRDIVAGPVPYEDNGAGEPPH